jgi:hypothetical protein
LLDVLNDPLFTVAFREFLHAQHTAHISMLLTQIRQKDRDVMKEAALAGKVDVYETLLPELQYFAERMMKEASQ